MTSTARLQREADASRVELADTLGQLRDGLHDLVCDLADLAADVRVADFCLQDVCRRGDGITSGADNPRAGAADHVLFGFRQRQRRA